MIQRFHFHAAAEPVRHFHYKARPPIMRQVHKAKSHPTDHLVGPLQRAIIRAVKKFAASIDINSYAADLQGHSGHALDLTDLEVALSVALAPLVSNLMRLGANGEAARIFDFALVNLKAATAAQLYTSWLVQGITDETRSALQTIMYRAFTEGLAPRQSGKQIAEALRGEPMDARLAARFGIMSAGLNERLANAALNYAQNLKAQGYSDASVMERTQTYADSLLAYRGDLIARTETIRASGMGQQALWDSAVTNGYLDSTTTTKMWSAAPSDRTCADCLDIDGQEVDVDGSFDTSDGPLDYPPLHGNCRCSAVLRFTQAQGDRTSAEDRLSQSVESQLTVEAGSMGDLGGDVAKAQVKKYSPDQPRVPAGGPGGGEFGDGGGGAATSADSLHAMQRYQAGGYQAINDHLRGIATTDRNATSMASDVENAAKYATAIESLQTPLESPMTLYRGLDGNAASVLTGLTPSGSDASSLSDAEVGASLGRMVGAEFTDQGLVSTSTDQSVAGTRTAYGGSGHVVLAIDVPAGTRAIEVNTVTRSIGYAAEKEILLQPGLTFRIDSIEALTVTSPFGTKSFSGQLVHASVVGGIHKREDVQRPVSARKASDRFVWTASDIKITKPAPKKGSK